LRHWFFSLSRFLGERSFKTLLTRQYEAGDDLLPIAILVDLKRSDADLQFSFER